LILFFRKGNMAVIKPKLLELPLRILILVFLSSIVICGATTFTGQDSSTDMDTIHVYADESIAAVAPTLFGQNFGPWMNKTDEFIEIYKDAGVPLLRFPAGNWGDENDISPNMVDDLHRVAEALSAEVVIHTRSWRGGTPEKAAELVRYANVEKGYGFKYWEVGNEPDLYLRRNSRKGDPVFDVNWYNTQFRLFANSMKAVDPDIKVVGPAVTGGWRDWIPDFIRENGDIVDVISWHWYTDGHETTPEIALTTPPEIKEQVNTIRGWWVDPEVNPKGYQRELPPLFLGEYSITWASGVRVPLATQVGALWVAETIGHMANLGVEMGAHFSLMGSPGGTRWHGLVDPLKKYRPVFGVFKMYKEWGTTQVRTKTVNPDNLPVFASTREDKSLAILVINKDQHLEQGAKITLHGFGLQGKAVVLQLTEGSPEPQELTPVEFEAGIFHTFPPASITLFTLKPALCKPIILGLAAIVIILVILASIVVIRSKKRNPDE
jgi:hypothetical protein